MNAAQIEEMHKRRGVHQVTGMPICPGDKCWCGLCHCTRCQEERKARNEPEFPERGPTDTTRSADV
jgi:hypothetical protein